MNLIVWCDHHRTLGDRDDTIANLYSRIRWIHIRLHGGECASTAELSNVLTKLRAVTLLNQVYLAATGTGAAVAMKLLLMHPDEFQGIALFNPDIAELPPIEFTQRLAGRGKRCLNISGRTISQMNRSPSKGSDTVFHGQSAQLRALLVTTVNQSPGVYESLALGRCLHSAGMQMTTHFYLPRWFSQQRMLQDLAEWVSHQDRLNQED